MNDEKREYLGCNGDYVIRLFINENSVYGIESNGDATYEGEEGFREMYEEIIRNNCKCCKTTRRELWLPGEI